MGARTQIFIKDVGVYIYSHNGSKTIIQDLRNILTRIKIKNNPEYIARLILEGLTKNCKSEYGFGISSMKHGDLDNLVILDYENDKVIIENYIRNKTINYDTINSFIYEKGSIKNKIVVEGTGCQSPYGIGEIIITFPDTKTGLSRAKKFVSMYYNNPVIRMPNGQIYKED
jgi:hypothetical protein